MVAIGKQKCQRVKYARRSPWHPAGLTPLVFISLAQGRPGDFRKIKLSTQVVLKPSLRVPPFHITGPEFESQLWCSRSSFLLMPCETEVVVT